MNIGQRIKYEVLKAGIEVYLRTRFKLGSTEMASPIVTSLINGITQLLATGDSGPMGPFAVSEDIPIGGQTYQATESVTVEIKRK